MIAGCAAGLLLVGTAMTLSGGGGAIRSSVQRVSGLVFSQGSENVIAPLAGGLRRMGLNPGILGAFGP